MPSELRVRARDKLALLHQARRIEDLGIPPGNRLEDADVVGIIDLIETEPVAGTTMLPFDEAPASMDVAHGVYPKASDKGAYDYHKTVSFKALTAAFEKAFDGQKLDLDRRVVFIHGVPSDTKLPSSVASLGPIPAHVTLPIACGKIEREKK